MEPERFDVSISIVWAAPLKILGDLLNGHLHLTHGSLIHATLEAEQSTLLNDTFSFAASAPARLNLTIAGAHLGPGAHATLLEVENNYHSFSFFLRDVNLVNPLYVPDCGVAVTGASDPRSYAEIAVDVASLSSSTLLQSLEKDPEDPSNPLNATYVASPTTVA